MTWWGVGLFQVLGAGAGEVVMCPWAGRDALC